MMMKISWSGSSARTAAAATAGLLLGFAAVDDEETVRVRLKSTSVKEGSYRLASGLAGELPKKAWRAKLFGRRYLFFDLDGNGRIEPGAADGFALEKTPFVVSLPQALLFPEGQYWPSHDDKDLVLTRQELGLDAELVADIAELNTMRMRGARTPVAIDVEACRHAELHLDYLEFNGLVQTLSLDIHNEDPGARGYTVEGAKAGQVGVIGFGRSLTEDLSGWYASAYHGAKILDPKLMRVGVARKHNLSLLYPVQVPWRGREPVLHPADGAVDIPVHFSPGGEIPNPAPGTNMGRGTGFPLIVMLPRSLHAKALVAFELFAPRDELVPGYVSTPHEPASQDLSDNLGCAFFVPEKPLAGATLYRARLEIEGMSAPLEWSFTTAKVEKERRRGH
jgi:hypothetical protein